jgi:putative transposase
VLVHVYCLMPNHYHLVVETPRGNLSQALGWLQVTYTVRFNRRHKRSGHLFQGRFKAQLVEAEGCAQSLVRYVHLNPVRPKDKTAVIAAQRREALDGYEWSSHRDYAGLRREPSWLCLDWLAYWGKGAAAHKEYRAFVGEAFGKESPNLWKELRGGLVLGGDALWRKAQAMIAQKEGQEERRLVQGQSGRELQEKARRLLEKERDKRVAIWVRVRLAGERGVDVGRALGHKDGSGVTQTIKRLEASAAEDKQLQKRMEEWKHLLSSVKS